MPVPWPEALVRRMRRLHRSAIFPLLAFALPTDCFICRRVLGPVQRLGACAGCWTALRTLPVAACAGCGLPASPQTDLLGPARGRCSTCILDPPATDRVRAAVVYDDVARSFLLRAKLGGREELLEPLGDQLARAVELHRLSRGSCTVIPVPSHPWVTLRRGFAPGPLLARQVARYLRLPLQRRILAKRLDGGHAAKRLRAGARRAAAHGAFRVRGRLDGARVLLVDDVMTTGATACACATALKRAGALEVRVAVWARTLPAPFEQPPRSAV